MGQINDGGSLTIIVAFSVVWEIHDIKDVGFDGSTQATTFKPLVEELVESSYELMLGWLRFDIVIPNIIIPSLKVIMSSMC